MINVARGSPAVEFLTLIQASSHLYPTTISGQKAESWEQARRGLTETWVPEYPV